MDTTVIGIPLTFLILTVILLWIIIGSKGHWSFKFILISVTIFFSFSLWNSVSFLIGWPTNDSVPENFELHHSIIEEPSEKDKKPGAIFMWASKIEEDFEKPDDFFNFFKIDESRPRSYLLPYSRPLHEEMVRALKLKQEGNQVMGSLESLDSLNKLCQECQNKINDLDLTNKSEAHELCETCDSDFSFSKNKDNVFHILPPPKIPNKMKNVTLTEIED